MIVPLPLPLNAIQIILIDLGFEMFIALSYAYDPPENKASMMKLAPRKPVTEESIARLRKKELRKSQASLQTSSWAVFFRPFVNMYHSFSEKEVVEVLVDFNLLSWSYLEAGTIETIGCFFAFFWAMYYSYGVTPHDAYVNANNMGVPDVNVTLGNGTILVFSYFTF